MGSRFTTDVKDAWEDGLRALINGISKNLKYVTYHNSKLLLSNVLIQFKCAINNRKKEDIADPQTNLTPHQIADVRRTWENIRKDRNVIVSAIFMK